MKTRLLALVVVSFVLTGLSAQSSTFIDDEGIMRWTETNEELCIFGTNYSVPFAYWDVRAPIGADYEKAIDEDVYHIARMGMDGYRIHVFESYISDTLGNLIYNRHFQLFDYLLYKLKERGIKMYITPMYLNDGRAGFTKKYGRKAGCLSNTEAFPAQENYLAKFISHVNPYTGIAYKDDPDIVAFEIVNEPGHWKRPELIVEYINRMYDAIRNTGCEKPVFYNMTTSAIHIDKILESKAQGGSLQWYPSGLTANHDQKGNMMPNVDQYYIPFGDKIRETKRPKFVYEFSPSDIGASSHIYPAMARSFREAGFQLAAHFAYDPLHQAYCNVEYRTHFLNLAYTPKKSIGMLIASEVFHQIPLYKSYGRYPDNNEFESFKLDYENDLAEMITEEKYLHSNHTRTLAPNPEKLKKVAGTGNSSIVKYEGTGAYFLDKLDDGIWRLEVMPDVVWVRDPFFASSVKRENSVIIWKEYPMTIELPDLGENYSIEGLNDGNEFEAYSEGETFTVSPGSYLLKREGKVSQWNGENSFENIRLKEYYAPVRKSIDSYVIHTPPREVSVNSNPKLTAKIVAPYEPEQVELIILGVGRGDVLPMKKIDAYNYAVEIPETFTKKERILSYHISIKNGDGFETFPYGVDDAHLLDRRIYSGDRIVIDTDPYRMEVVSGSNPICLFDAEYDANEITKLWRDEKLDCLPMSIPGKMALQLDVNSLIDTKFGETDFTIRSYCRDRIEERSGDLLNMTELEVYGNSLNGKSCKLQVAMIMSNGVAYGGEVQLDVRTNSYRLKLKDMKRVKSVLLPHAYPSFQKYWFESEAKEKFDIAKVESVQLSIGPGIPAAEHNDKHGVAIAWILLH